MTLISVAGRIDQFCREFEARHQSDAQGLRATYSINLFGNLANLNALYQHRSGQRPWTWLHSHNETFFFGYDDFVGSTLHSPKAVATSAATMTCAVSIVTDFPDFRPSSLSLLVSLAALVSSASFRSISTSQFDYSADVARVLNCPSRQAGFAACHPPSARM